MPDSMIVVETSTSASPARNACMRSSSSRSGIWPCATRKRSSGQSCRSFSAASSIDLDAVVQVERLARAGVLALERDARPVSSSYSPDDRADRPPSLRRRLDDRDVAQARERHVERPRDRGGREREHVDLEAQCPQQLLLLRRRTAAPRRRPRGRAASGSRRARGSGACRRAPRPCPRRTRASTCFTSAGLRKRETISTRTGKSR